MSTPSDETHDASRESWVESTRSHPVYPLQNLTFGIFRSLMAITPDENTHDALLTRPRARRRH